MQAVSVAAALLLAGIMVAAEPDSRTAFATMDFSAEALDGEDECQAPSEGGSCALSAIQRRGSPVSSAADIADNSLYQEGELAPEDRAGQIEEVLEAADRVAQAELRDGEQHPNKEILEKMAAEVADAEGIPQAEEEDLGGKAETVDVAVAMAEGEREAGLHEDELLDPMELRSEEERGVDPQASSPDQEDDEEEFEEEEFEEDDVDADAQTGTALLGLTPVDKIPVYHCHGENGTACPDGEICIARPDGAWSQCFSCSPVTFGQECQKLDDYLRYTAVRTCGLTCLDTKCYNRDWCHSPYRCIVDKEAQWGTCINCHSKKYWTASCFATPPGLRKIASRTCHRRCR